MAKIKKGGGVSTSQPVAQELPQRKLPPPKVAPRAIFYYKAHPLRWKVAHGRLIPDLGKLHGTPGCNGVDRDRNGNPTFATAIAMTEEHGWKVIPHDVDGHGTSYIRKVDSIGGYIDKWTTLYPGSSVEEVDTEAFAAWAESLVDRGILEPCPEYIVQSMKSDLEKNIALYQDKNQKKFEARIKRMAADLDVVSALLAA